MAHSEIFNAFLITTIALTLVTTVLAKFRVPTIVGFILTGLLIGPSGLNWVNSIPAATTIAEFGIVLLMFTLGLEISLVQLKKLFRPLIVLGLGQVGLTNLAGFLIFYFLFQISFSASLVFGALLALSSTAVVLKLLQEQRETETPHGRTNIIILLFQDIISLPMMMAVPILAIGTRSLGQLDAVAWIVAKIGLLLVGCFFAGIYIVPRLFALVSSTRSRELFFFLLTSFTLIVASLSEMAGLSMSLGAFVAGVLISESPYSKQALAELSPLRDVFLGIFFASIGMLLDLSFVGTHWQGLIILVPILFGTKFLILYGLVRWNTGSHGLSLSSAMALSQIGEFSFILAVSAKNQGLMADTEFQYFLALAVLSLVFTPLFFQMGLRSVRHSGWPDLAYELTSFLGRPAAPPSTAAKNSEPVVVARKAIVLGLGHTGLGILKALHEYSIPCVGVDLESERIQRLSKQGLSVVFGDATRVDLLEAIGVRESFMVIVAVNGRHITSQIVSVLRGLAPEVKLVIRLQYLQEAEELGLRPNEKLVVAEAETAVRLQQDVLDLYSLWNDSLNLEWAARNPSGTEKT